jgi:hypothetical protein
MESQSIIEFKIVYCDKKIKTPRRPISELLVVESLLIQQGIGHVQMIIFYFNDSRFYPYGIHPIILKQYDNKLYVIFYHYLDVHNQIVGLSVKQRLDDYRCVVHLLDRPDGVLLPLLQPPVITV